LVRKLEPDLRRAFEAAVADLRDKVDWPRLLEALRNNQIEAAIDALNIEPAAFQRYAALQTSIYSEAGAATVASIALPSLVAAGVRFDMTNPAAERWIAENVGAQITRITTEQVALARQVILEGYQAGQGPQNIAIDLVGRVQNGTRQGGVMGLDVPRAERLRIVSDAIKTAEGVRDLVIEKADGTLQVKYKVNKTTEAAILRAYRAGKAVPADKQLRLMAQYSNRLLKERAETVARFETASSVMAARRQAWAQIMDRRNIPPEAVGKRWVHGGSVKEPRPHHLAMSGQTVVGIDTPFQFSNGAALQYAHDVNAPLSETILCGCSTEFFILPDWNLR
jgi:hypothetical protein